MPIMTLEYDFQVREHYAREEGITIGAAESQERMSSLIKALSSLGRIDDITKAADDPAYLEKLFKEFGL